MTPQKNIYDCQTSEELIAVMPNDPIIDAIAISLSKTYKTNAPKGTELKFEVMGGGSFVLHADGKGGVRQPHLRDVYWASPDALK